MIEGILIDVTADEMKSLLLKQADVHKRKIVFYETKATALEGVEGLGEGKMSSIDPVAAVKEKIVKHVDMAAYLQFLHDHIVAGEVYRLEREDLRVLGVLPERHW